jgi:hypothetical protein
MNLLTDPKAFNYLIMVLYFINSIRWAFAGNYGQVVYWVSAFFITFSVTCMMGKL